MDRRTRQRNARQELVVLFSLLLTAALAWLVAGIVRRDQLAIITGALLALSLGFNLVGQLRRTL